MHNYDSSYWKPLKLKLYLILNIILSYSETNLSENFLIFK